MRVEISSSARQDIRSSVTFYVEQGAELAAAFLDDLDDACSLVSKFPEIGSPVEDGNRKVVLQSYPHTLIYRVEGDRIFVLAVGHQRRKPGYWKK